MTYIQERNMLKTEMTVMNKCIQKQQRQAKRRERLTVAVAACLAASEWWLRAA